MSACFQHQLYSAERPAQALRRLHLITPALSVTLAALHFPQYLPAFAVLHVWIGSCLQEGLCNLSHLCHDIWGVLLGAVGCHKVQRSLLVSQCSSIHTGTIFNEKVCSKFISFCETKQGYSWIYVACIFYTPGNRCTWLHPIPYIHSNTISAPRMPQQQATSTMLHSKVRIKIFHNKTLKKVICLQVTCDSSSHTSLLL